MHRDDRAVLAVAVPAFAALVAEPLMLLADTAIVGHLGTEPLAGLAIASTVLTTLVGLCIFLAYGSPASVSRRFGAGDRAGAMTNGFHGEWLAVQLGALLMVVLWFAAPAVSGALASSSASRAVRHIFADGSPGGARDVDGAGGYRRTARHIGSAHAADCDGRGQCA